MRTLASITKNIRDGVPSNLEKGTPTKLKAVRAMLANEYNEDGTRARDRKGHLKKVPAFSTRATNLNKEERDMLIARAVYALGKQQTLEVNTYEGAIYFDYWGREIFDDAPTAKQIWEDNKEKTIYVDDSGQRLWRGVRYDQ